MYDEYRFLLSESASSIFPSIDFGDDASSILNRQAPAPRVSFLLAALVCSFTCVYWRKFRYRHFSDTVKDPLQPMGLKFRALIASIADNDDPAFTILRVSAQSLALLGGFQLNYKGTILFMLAYYALLSVSDSVRVLLALDETECLQELVIVSKRDKRFLLNSLKMIAENRCTLKLDSANVYENISRNFVVVMMVFITQTLLITFVVIDVFHRDRITTFSGTPNVPIVGTLGSWSFYLLGIFMQCVYLLGPNTNFGTSEQNPHFWLTLLLAAKKSGAQCSWHDASTDKDKSIQLLRGDVRLWIRFLLSFLINGVGFHILVHALPIQLAGQSSLTGVVFRAVGMLYLTNLDDSPATTLTLTEAAAVEKKDSTHDDAQEKRESDNEMERSSSLPVERAHAMEMCLERARLQAQLLQSQLQSELSALAMRHSDNSKKFALSNMEDGDPTHVAECTINEGGEEGAL